MIPSARHDQPGDNRTRTRTQQDQQALARSRSIQNPRYALSCFSFPALSLFSVFFFSHDDFAPSTLSTHLPSLVLLYFALQRCWFPQRDVIALCHMAVSSFFVAAHI